MAPAHPARHLSLPRYGFDHRCRWRMECKRRGRILSLQRPGAFDSRTWRNHQSCYGCWQFRSTVRGNTRDGVHRGIDQSSVLAQTVSACGKPVQTGNLSEGGAPVLTAKRTLAVRKSYAQVIRVAVSRVIGLLK